MSLGEKIIRGIICTVIAGFSFGMWQHNWFAGLFMTVIVLLFSGLVVAVQHGMAHPGDWFEDKK